MLKAFIGAILIIVLATAAVFFTKRPSFIYDKTFGRVLGQSIEQGILPGTDSTFPLSPPSLIDQSQSTLENKSQQLTGTLKDSVFNTAQSGLDTIFNKQPTNSTPVTVQVLDPSSTSITQQSITVVDLSKDNNLKLALPRSSKYDLQFQNTQSNQCLYINANKYPIENSKIIEIEFSSSGSYPIKVNSCDLNDKVIGEFDVQ